jgi:cytochrome P450
MKSIESLVVKLMKKKENGDIIHRTPTVKDIPYLEYTEKVLRESMRLYPPAWTLGRQVMGTYNLGEYVIPPGSIILMSQYVMHRNPLYFPDPEPSCGLSMLHLVDARPKSVGTRRRRG